MTNADKKIIEATLKIEDAIECINQVINTKCNGVNDFTEAYKLRLNNVLNNLRNARNKLI